MSCALYVGRARAPSPCHAVGPTQRRGSMKPSTKNQAKGKLHELKGKAKEVAGLAHPGPGPGSGGEGREDDGEGAGKGRRDRGGPRSVAGHAGPTYPVVSSAAIPGFHVALIPETDVVSHVASGTRMRWRIRGAARRLRTQAGRSRVSRWSHRWPHAAVLPHRAARVGGRRADGRCGIMADLLVGVAATRQTRARDAWPVRVHGDLEESALAALRTSRSV
jgi:hypothetical protein